jgi:hypothetical protein
MGGEGVRILQLEAMERVYSVSRAKKLEGKR